MSSVFFSNIFPWKFKRKLIGNLMICPGDLFCVLKCKKDADNFILQLTLFNFHANIYSFDSCGSSKRTETRQVDQKHRSFMTRAHLDHLWSTSLQIKDNGFSSASKVSFHFPPPPNQAIFSALDRTFPSSTREEILN